MSRENKEIKTYFGRCRCCLDYGYLNNMWEEHYNGDEMEIYGDMLTQCYALSWENPVSVKQDQICEKCVQKLRSAYDFRKLVIKSQRELMQEMENDKLQEPKLEVPVIKTEAADDTQTVSANIMYEDGALFSEENGIDMDTEDVEKDAVFYEDVEYLEEEVTLDTKGATKESLPAESELKRQRKKIKWPEKLSLNEPNKKPGKTLTAKLRKGKNDVPEKNKTKITDKGDSKCDEAWKDNTTADVEDVPSKHRKGVNALVEEMNKHRDNIRSVLQSSNATMVKAHCSKGYTCCFCPENFPQPADLKRHNLETHEDASIKAIHVKYVSDLIIKLDITGLRCIICGIKGTNLETFMDHLKRSHNKPIHKDVKNYIIPFRFDTEKLECVICSKQFIYFKVLSEHMNEHYKNFECPVCGRGFVNKQSLSTHSYRHQKNVGEFKCSHCLKVFDTRHKRSAHVRRVHMYMGKTRKCHVCNEKFTSSPQVQNHMVKAHGAEPLVFKCGACDKTYNNSRSLSEHKKRYHLMLRPHKCSSCEMCFYSRMELNTHIVTHTKTKEFQCDICDKRFGTKCCLNQHMRSHYGIKRHKCDRCDIKFAARSKWKLHMWKKHREVV